MYCQAVLRGDDSFEQFKIILIFFFSFSLSYRYFLIQNIFIKKIQPLPVTDFSFTHKGIATDLVTQHYNGLDLKGVFEKMQNSKYSQKSFLDNHNINTSFDKNPKNMHHKVFIKDNTTIITGSFNPSSNADKSDDENILIISSNFLAGKYLKEFERVFN
ncbi:MAG: phospholipase D-like domain-containing protein [Candidatus Woesearchaeota archaeon]